MRVQGSAAVLRVEGRERLLGTATDPLIGFSPSELEEITNSLLAADSDQELCRTCKGAGVHHARGVPNADGQLVCERGHTWAPGEGAVREKAPSSFLSERQLKERRTREIFCEAGIPVGVTEGQFWRTHPRGRPVNRSPSASFYR